MSANVFLADENDRLARLAEYDAAGSFDDGDFAPILALARELFEVASAFVSLVGHDEQVFVAKQGLTLCRTDRSVSFCTHAIAHADVMVVLDAREDNRFRDNPLVLGPPFIRFYVGAPLVDAAGAAIGTLCIAGDRPRDEFPQALRNHLQHLAAIVLGKLELRRLALAGVVGQTRFENIAATSPDSIVCADHDNRIVFWNAAAERLFGRSAAEAVGQPLTIILPERFASAHATGLSRVARGEAPRIVGKVLDLAARRANGTEFPIELSLSMWRDGEHRSFGAIIRDISERKAREEELFLMAHQDTLTGLPNRAALRRRVEALTGPAVLLLVNLDGFRMVNDDHGHSVGDAVLVEAASRLLHCLGPGDIAARLGNDEFAVLMAGTNNDADRLAAELVQSLGNPLPINGALVFSSASVGMARYPENGATADDLLSSAGFALRDAKSGGRQCYRVYTPHLRRAHLYDTELHRALEREEFEVFYQPQVRIQDGALTGAEALLRWRHPEDGLLSPDRFMSGLVNRPVSLDVGNWVLEKACTQAAQWRASGWPDFRMGVNLFGSQLLHDGLFQRVGDVLLRNGLQSSNLELEVTENIVLRADDQAVSVLRRLRAEGVGIAFDDYGTGFASLSMLKQFPLTRLKIDKSFVTGICDSKEDAAIVWAVLHMGRAFGLDVIAEGVETPPQLEWLRHNGCSEAQGYLFGRPMPAAEFAIMEPCY